MSRLETMVLMGLEIPIPAIRRQIASGIDIMVHLGRMRDKSRKVLEILELTGYDFRTGEILTNTLYEFREEGKAEAESVKGSLVRTGRLTCRQKLERAGIALEEDFADGREVNTG